MESKGRLQPINKLKARLFEDLEEEEDYLNKETEKFELKVKSWEEASAKLRKTHFPSMINLNVGGRTFSTSLSNLQRYPDSYFGVMFSERWDTKAGEDGRYFIDRGPRVFDYIIDYLRGEPLELGLISKEKKATLLREAKFYQLYQLVDILEPPIVKGNWELKPSPYGDLSDDNMTFTKLRGRTDWDCNVLGSIGWSSGIHEWSVILGKNCRDEMIGIATNNTNPTALNYSSIGYYIYTNNGSLYGQNGVSGTAYHHNRLHENQRISVKLDMDAKSLTFAVDGVWKGIAWSNLPQATYYPSFDVYTNLATFTVSPQ